MKTININGKEYTESWFTKYTGLKGAFSSLNVSDYGDFLEEAFEFLRDEFPRHEPEPPKLRPMSELPEGRTFDFIARIERKDNGFKFHECMERNDYLVQGSHKDFAFFESENYENEEFKMLGWLYELPTPNDIKL